MVARACTAVRRVCPQRAGSGMLVIEKRVYLPMKRTGRAVYPAPSAAVVSLAEWTTGRPQIANLCSASYNGWDRRVRRETHNG